jgi:hypothetical protein
MKHIIFLLFVTIGIFALNVVDSHVKGIVEKTNNKLKELNDKNR